MYLDREDESRWQRNTQMQFGNARPGVHTFVCAGTCSVVHSPGAVHIAHACSTTRVCNESECLPCDLTSLCFISAKRCCTSAGRLSRPGNRNISTVRVELPINHGINPGIVSPMGEIGYGHTHGVERSVLFDSKQTHLRHIPRLW